MSESSEPDWIDVVHAEDGKLCVLFCCAAEFFAFDLPKTLASQLQSELAYCLSTDSTAGAKSSIDENEIAKECLARYFTATGALIALQLRHLPDEVRTRVMDAVRNGTGKVELRTRVESNETELVLVPTDGWEALWLARTSA